MTYKEIKDNFFEEVGKVDISKLGLTFGGLRDFAELLKIMAEIPAEPREDSLKYAMQNACAISSGISSFSVPRKEEEGK